MTLKQLRSCRSQAIRFADLADKVRLKMNRMSQGATLREITEPYEEVIECKTAAFELMLRLALCVGRKK